ncbi:GD11936 [Drosophila simulans]|uniref:GD11936 n=1 Tax=Drosophila simulans TaxID=7240 RepID=B4NTJ4_DROSI|nr:GD11936 [Drosophila simulans]
MSMDNGIRFSGPGQQNRMPGMLDQQQQSQQQEGVQQPPPVWINKWARGNSAARCSKSHHRSQGRPCRNSRCTCNIAIIHTHISIRCTTIRTRCRPTNLPPMDMVLQECPEVEQELILLHDIGTCDLVC